MGFSGRETPTTLWFGGIWTRIMDGPDGNSQWLGSKVLKACSLYRLIS